ncbi:MAG TPA: SDR family NAD(P)-dependent oxidoreductase [Anaeromyxobacter sp.]|nr:SDR family NAD(P)-dependent oxidoreductase [Anaeromyxobacter sp.]
MSHEPALADLVALVTGATSGIGLACARGLVRAGARVVAAGRRGDRLARLAAEVGPALHPLVLDVRDAAGLESALEGLPPPLGQVDVLVNSAGLALGMEPAQRASLPEWETMIATNCSGLVALTRALLPGMVARDRGHVLNIGSVAATYAYPGGNVYGASKAFVRQFSFNLKADLLGTRVRVTCIEPAMVETEFSLVRLGGDAERAAKVYEGMQPLTPEDVADAVLFCLTRPRHVDVTLLELFPVDQGPGPFAVHRRQ